MRKSNNLTNLNLIIQSKLLENDNVKWVETCWDHNKWLLLSVVYGAGSRTDGIIQDIPECLVIRPRVAESVGNVDCAEKVEISLHREKIPYGNGL